MRKTPQPGAMAAPEDGMRSAAAALPSWYCSLERESYYRRTDYIHEMSSVNVGSHLYSLMCCAGRSERPVREEEGGRGWRAGLAEAWAGGVGEAGPALTFSMPPL